MSARLGTAEASSQSLSVSSDVLLPRVEARDAASSPGAEDPMLERSDSGELDVLSIGAVEVITRARHFLYARLNLTIAEAACRYGSAIKVNTRDRCAWNTG